MKKSGFTLIELMIVIAIIGILAAIAVPQYSQYTKRAKFSEVKIAVQPVKVAVELCYHQNNGLDACNSTVLVPGISGQVPAITLTRAASAALVEKVTLSGTTFPIIEVTSATGVDGFSGETFVLTGQSEGTAGVDRAIKDWVESGTACDEGWC